MQVDLVNRLVEFGFTVNQAKVYLDIVQSGSTSVGQISKNTMLHRQDIYKLLPKLEKMGLITRTIDKPVIIEALPVEKALERIIAQEKEAVDKKISRLEKALTGLAQEIRQQPKIANETHFTLLITSAALKNRITLTFKTKPSAFRVVSTTENLKGQAGRFYKKYFQMIADTGVKIYLILVGAENQVELKRLIEKLAPKGGVLHAKSLELCPSKDYQVVDSDEVWIATQPKMPEGYPVILWTNDPNMVETYLANFDEAWNNPMAASLLDGAGRQMETLKAVSIQH